MGAVKAARTLVILNGRERHVYLTIRMGLTPAKNSARPAEHVAMPMMPVAAQDTPAVAIDLMQPVDGISKSSILSSRHRRPTAKVAGLAGLKLDGGRGGGGDEERESNGDTHVGC